MNVIMCLPLISMLVGGCRQSSAKPPMQELPVQDLPMTIWYQHNDLLTVRLLVSNIPISVASYEINIFQENKRLPALVTSSLLEDKRTNPVILLKNRLLKPYSNSVFKLSLKYKNNSDCHSKGGGQFLKIVHYDEKNKPEKSKCLTNTCNINLDWHNECINSPPNIQAAYPQKPEITPTKFEDSGDPVIVFTCRASCRPEEVLVWLQDKGLHEPVVLMVNQTYNENFENEMIKLINTQVTLVRTLEDADRDSSIYCSKRIISRNEPSGPTLALSSDRSNAEINSEKITLAFKRTIKTVKPTVALEPAAEVGFEPNTTKEFECSSTLIDGRVLTWYEEDPNSSPSTIKPAPNQTMDQITKRNTLKLYLDETYDGKSLYCIQEHRLIYLTHRTSSEMIYFSYGENARSEEITLHRIETRDDAKSAGWVSDRSFKLLVAGACVVGALALLLVGLLVSRSRCQRRLASDAEEEDQYVTPQVTYAVLALPETDSKLPKKQDKQNYVEIVGVYKNKSNK